MMRLKLNDGFTVALATVCLAMSQTAMAGPVDTPNTFSSGTPAVASEVNDNFAAFETAINDNDARIAGLIAQVENLVAVNTELGGRIDELAVKNQDLANELAEATAFINDLRGFLSLQDDNQGNPAVVFSGVNVHINNGEGESKSINGVGNLIIGYDEPGEDGAPICSDGRFDNADDCSLAGGVFAAVHKSGSHMLVIGPAHNYSRAVGMVTGKINTVNGDFSFAAGTSNRASGESSAVTGGTGGIARGVSSSIAGGNRGIATGNFSSVMGGQNNIAFGDGSIVVGGASNTAIGGSSSVTGGAGNSASGALSSVTGGAANTASGNQSSVSGGGRNFALGVNSSVSGGFNRTAENLSDWVAGTLIEDN